MKAYITKKHIVFEVLSYVVLWGSIVTGIIWSAKLPDQVATHFDVAGNPDGYGSPYSFLIMPVIMLLSVGMCSLILHLMPAEMWNTPVKVKPEKAIRIYRDIVWTVVLMQLVMAVFTLYCTLTSYLQTMKGMTVATIIFMVLLFADIIWCIVACVVHNR